MTKSAMLGLYVIAICSCNKPIESSRYTNNIKRSKILEFQNDSAIRNLYARIELSELQIKMLKKHTSTGRKNIESISSKAISYQKNDNPPQ